MESSGERGLRIRLAEGDPSGRLVAFEDGVLTLVLPRALAPGAPLTFAVVDASGEERRFEGRSLGARRTEGGHFRVRMRPVNLRREDRAFLRARLE